jgi:hypothetical protein
VGRVNKVLEGVSITSVVSPLPEIRVCSMLHQTPNKAGQVLSLVLRVRQIMLARTIRTFSSSTLRMDHQIPVLRSLSELRKWRKSARDRGLKVGVVPTVSNPQASSKNEMEMLIPTDGRFASRSPGFRYVYYNSPYNGK